MQSDSQRGNIKIATNGAGTDGYVSAPIYFLSFDINFINRITHKGKRIRAIINMAKGVKKQVLDSFRSNQKGA